MSEESEQQKEQVESLLMNAPRDDGKEQTKNRVKYIPIKHSHHYDDKLSHFISRYYHQPIAEGTKERLRELVIGDFKFVTEKDVSIGDRQNQNILGFSKPFMSTDVSNNTKKNDGIFSVAEAGTTGHTVMSVSYVKSAPNSKISESSSFPDHFIVEYDSKDNAKISFQKSTGDEATLIPYTSIKYNPRNEIQRKTIDDKMSRLYTKRSKKWGLVSKSSEYYSTDDEEITLSHE